MKTSKQNPDFLNIGTKILIWYDENARVLPWRTSQTPYNIWICEIILQQTQVQQGLPYYEKFIERFPDVNTLANAQVDEVLLYWKGLGYYSRALNLHYAARQIVEDFNGIFPTKYTDILKLKGIGKYTAAAIASICFNKPYPAIDGNFYRVFSRLFADGFDISKSSAFGYFSELASRVMPLNRPGDFNQAIMDLGAGICKPQNPSCTICPIHTYCLAYQTGTIANFPVKNKKTKIETITLNYYFIYYKNLFLSQRRDRSSIWKNLYEFPTNPPMQWETMPHKKIQLTHRLTHKKLLLTIYSIEIPSEEAFFALAQKKLCIPLSITESTKKSFPKPLERFISDFFG